MKTFIITIFASIFSIYTFSQEVVEKSLAISKNRDVAVNFDFADQIIIKKWDMPEAFVKVIVNINDNEDNDKFILELKESSGKIVITGEVEDLEEISNYETEIHLGEIIRSDNHCINMEIDCEIYLPDVSQLNIETISGDIEVIDFETPIEAQSISGFIDVSLKESAAATIKMETITGEFYSDLDLETAGKTEWKHHWIGGKLESRLNGGGYKIHLESISGNIYLRKL